MAGTDIFSYLNDLYDLLTDQDRTRLGELWTAYEQCYGSIWVELIERLLASNINTLPLYNTKRWLLHTFDGTTLVNLSASYESNQDLSLGINLTNRYLIRFSVDGGPQIEVNLQGLIPADTKGPEIVATINLAAGFAFASLVVNNALLEFNSPSRGSGSNITFYPASVPSADASAIILGLDPATLPLSIPEFPYSFQLSDPAMVHIPQLQDKIRVESVTRMLTEDTDYSIEFGTGIISFLVPPFPTLSLSSALISGNTIVTVSSTASLAQGMAVAGTGIPENTYIETITTMTQFSLNNAPTQTGGFTLGYTGGSFWAQNTLVNLETPYNNFGYLMGIYNQNTPAYLKTLKGLWFAFWTGPTPENIRTSLYLLFGLPTASQVGTVTSQTTSTITLTYTDNSTETFTIPTGLISLVVTGQSVTQFYPLVSGIQVLDKVNNPGFVAREIGRAGIQPFLTQYASRGPGPDTDETKALSTIEQNTYLPQIDVNTFVSTDISLANIKTFLTNIQPKSRTYFFQILVGNFRDPLNLYEALSLGIDIDVTPNLDYNPSLEIQQSDRVDAETNPLTGDVMDSEVMKATEFVDVAVYDNFHTSPVLVDSFHVEG